MHNILELVPILSSLLPNVLISNGNSNQLD